MIAILGFLTRPIVGPLSAGASMIFMVCLVVTFAQKVSADHHVKKLTHEIEAPVTGYKAQLVEADAAFNKERHSFLEANGALGRQTKAVLAARTEADRRVAKGTADAQASRHDYEQRAGKQVAAILALKAVGDKCVAAFNLLRSE